MPRPLPLPAEPQFAAHVSSPAAVLAALADYLPGSMGEPRATLRALVPDRLGPVVGQLVDLVDLKRPWAAALVQDQLIVHVPIAPNRVADTRQLLADKPAVGKFGAVTLGTGGGPLAPKVAWFDARDLMLTLAADLPGLATGAELSRHYGKSPLFATVDGPQLAKLVPRASLSRIEIAGAGPADFRISAQGSPAPQVLEQISEGALTGLLANPKLVAGVTTRYAKHDELIKSLISQATRAVNGQNFLVRGVLTDMLKRYNAVLRSWNGRVLLGLGAGQHIVMAFGADDPARASGAVNNLVASAMSNLGMAKTLGVSVPTLRFKRNRLTSESVGVHSLALVGVRRMMPREYAALLDADGDLRIAYGGSPRAGAVLVAIGPDAANTLGKWLTASKAGPTGADTRNDLLAGSFLPRALPSLDPGSLASVPTLLGLRAEGAPTTAVVQRRGDRFNVTVRGPAPKRTAGPRRGPLDPADPRRRGRRPSGA